MSRRRFDVMVGSLPRNPMTFTVENEREDDGRWLAEVLELPGGLAYGESSDEAITKAQALALRVVAGRLEHGEGTGQFVEVSFAAAGVSGPQPKPHVFLRRCFEAAGLLNVKPFSQSSCSSGLGDAVFAFHDKDEIGPKMLARVAKHTGLRPDDL